MDTESIDNRFLTVPHLQCLAATLPGLAHGSLLDLMEYENSYVHGISCFIIDDL